MGMLTINSKPVTVLFDSDASHSFLSTKASWIQCLPKDIYIYIYAYTKGRSVSGTRVFGCISGRTK